MAIQIGGTTVIDNSRNLTNIASIFSCTGIASQAEAEAGSSSTKLMTPQRVAQAIAALSGGSVINRIQRGTTYTARNPPGYGAHPGTNVNVPITSVNLNKAFVSQGNRAGVVGYTGPLSNSVMKSNGGQAAFLTSSTVLNVQAGPAQVGGPVAYSRGKNEGFVTWEVIEFV